MLIQISVRAGTNNLHPLILALPTQGLVGLSSMQIALFPKLLNAKHSVLFLQLKLSTLLCYPL